MMEASLSMCNKAVNKFRNAYTDSLCLSCVTSGLKRLIKGSIPLFL